MKTRFKLLVLALALLVVAFCIAACGEDPADTTAPATSAPASSAPASSAPASSAPASSDPGTTPPTSQAPTTPPPAAGTLHPDCVGLELVTEDTPFTGGTVATSWGLSKRISFADVTYTFRQIDPVSGALIANLEKTKPVKSGTYEVTASFAFKRNAKDEDKQYTLPEPMTKRFVVTAGTLDPAKINFGAKDTEIYMRPSLSFNPAESTVVVGTPSVGLERNFSIVKLAGKDDTSAGTAVTTPGLITEADGAGYYRVTIGYTEKDNGENWTNEQSVTHEAIVYVRTIEKQVKKADGIVIDGVIDEEYRMSASYTTAFQDFEEIAGGAYNLLGDVVDPYKLAALLKFSRGAEVTEPNNTADATFYVLWGEEGEEGAKQPYIYVAIEVEDETKHERSAQYVANPNPWINDSVELYYTFGHDVAPDMSNKSETYPTFNCVIRDSRTGGNVVGGKIQHSAVDAQKSIYFDQINSAVQGRGENDNTYVIEYKFPAKRESYNMEEAGNPLFERSEGDALVAGDFIYLACQLNDLTGLPAGYASIEEYDANIPTVQKYPNAYTYAPDKDSPWYNFEYDLSPYVASYGNRAIRYMKSEGGAPMVFQLSSESAAVEINGTDGVKDADYSAGYDLTYVPSDADGEPLNDFTASDYAEATTSYIYVDGMLYIYTTVAGAVDTVTYYIGDSVEIVINADGTTTAAGVTATLGTLTGGHAHELVIDLTTAGITSGEAIYGFVTSGTLYQMGE